MNISQDNQSAGAGLQDVMSAWIFYAAMVAALVVSAFAFDLAANFADRSDDRMALQAPITQVQQSQRIPVPDTQSFLTQPSVLGLAEP